MKLRPGFFCVLFLLSFFYIAEAENTNRLSSIKTEYFEIIYPEVSAETAALLAEYGDGLADEICLLLNTSMKERIPVYINPDVQILNAYFSPYPYNRIVIYDTTTTDGSLGGFRNTILKVFYHELTHAVSLNIRTPFWQFMSRIFGDVVSINMAITMPTSFVEGVTVSFESRDGEGRVNDPLTRHFFIQDKIEEKFLSWKEAAGSRDIYPGATASYLYGGAFSFYLQKTYGMEKYAELWKRGSAFNPFLGYLQPRFKQVYKISIEDAWVSFRNSITVPEGITENSSFLFGKESGIYSALASGPDGFVWSDRNTNAVWFRSFNGSVVRLFDSDSTLNRLSLSADGKLLLVSDAEISGTATRSRLRVFALAEKRFLDEFHYNLRDASFAGDDENICAIDVLSQRSALVLFSRNNAMEKRILMTGGPDSAYYSLYNPVFAGSGKLACIAANGLERQILLIDTITGNTEKLALPPEVRFIRYLQGNPSENGPVLTFSWTDKVNMYRYAVFQPGNGMLTLQDANYSGGVFFPVTNFECSRIFYVASFSGKDSLMFFETDTAKTYSVSSSKSEPPIASAFSLLPVSLPSSHFYNPLPWFMDGLFVPFPKIMPIKTGLENIAPGFLYITTDPAERYALSFNPSFSVDPFFTDFSLQTNTRAAGFSVFTALEDHLMGGLFKDEPYRDTSLSLSLNRSYILGPSWKSFSLSLTGMSNWYAPDILYTKNPYDAAFTALSLSAGTDVNFSAVRRKKIPQFPLFAVNATGYSASLGLYFVFHFPENAASPVIQNQLSLYTPFVPLTLSFSGAWTDGIFFSPLSVFAGSQNARGFKSGFVGFFPVFPEYSATDYGNIVSQTVFGAVAELTPLTVEIQRGLPVLPVYANRILCVTGYRSMLFNVQGISPIYVDSVYGKVSVRASAIIGALTSVVLSGNAEYAYALRARKGGFIFSFTYVLGL